MGKIVKQVITTPRAPAAIGPYSQGIKAGNLLFVSGQIPIDPATGALIEAKDRLHRCRGLASKANKRR